MKQEGTPLSPAETQTFDALVATLDQEHEQRVKDATELLTGQLERELSAQRAADSWRVTPRPNPLEEFDDTQAQPRADGRKNVPLGHVAFMGDFSQD